MRRPVDPRAWAERCCLVLVGVLCLGACCGDEDDAADTIAASTTARRGEPIVIRSTLIVAAEEGSEPIALVAAA